MKIIFFGTGPFGLPALKAIRASSHELLGVVSSPDKPQGRSLKTQSSPIKEWAVTEGVPVLEFSRELEQAEADVWVVIAFGFLLPKAMLSMPKVCALNVHASLLPVYRGASPIQSALLHGDPETGVSVMRMAERLDAGDVLIQKKIPVVPTDYFLDLEKKLSVLSAEALMEGLRLLGSNQAVFKPQDESRATVCRKISKEDGHVNWNDHAENIRNRVRAFQQWPGAYSFYLGKRILWHQMDIGAHAMPVKAHPGMILPSPSAAEIHVAAKDKPLKIGRLQLEGRRALPSEEFLKGFHLEADRILE